MSQLMAYGLIFIFVVGVLAWFFWWLDRREERERRRGDREQCEAILDLMARREESPKDKPDC